MAFCSKCGANLNEGVAFCASCGAPAASTPAGGSGGLAAPASTAGSTPLASNVAGLLAYIPFVGWIISIIFIVMDPYSKDKFVRFHAFQSLFLAIAAFVLSIVFSIVSRILGVIPIVGWVIGGAIESLLWLGIIGVHVFLMLKANNKEKYKLPVIGDFAEQQAG